jgi:transcriptional regulator with XRE-family HTH domain
VNARTGLDSAEMLDVIGQRLRDLRKSNNLSQREVADAIGLPQSNLSRIENGKQRLNLTVLAGMLAIYNTSIQEFFAREEAAAAEGDALTSRERQLMDSYRRLSPEDRREVDAYVDFRLFRARRDKVATEPGLE